MNLKKHAEIQKVRGIHRQKRMIVQNLFFRTATKIMEIREDFFSSLPFSHPARTHGIFNLFIGKCQCQSVKVFRYFQPRFRPCAYARRFLDASAHLYKRVCPSVRPSVRHASFLDASSHLYKRVCPSVGPSVRWSVRPSVRNVFVKIAENGVMQDEGASRAVYPALFNDAKVAKMV